MATTLEQRIGIAEHHGMPQITTEPAPRPILDDCKCGREFSGWSLDLRRNMWVCGNCRKPSPLNQSLHEECDNCERYYTIEVYPDNMLLCPDCI